MFLVKTVWILLHEKATYAAKNGKLLISNLYHILPNFLWFDPTSIVLEPSLAHPGNLSDYKCMTKRPVQIFCG